MKQFHRFHKFMAALMVFTMLFGSVPAWATGHDIVIQTNGQFKVDGGSATTTTDYSNTAYVGVDGKMTTIGTDVVNSITTDGETTQMVYGIRYGDNSELTVGSLAGGIAVNSTSLACGIRKDNTGKTTVTGLGGIYANSSGGTAYGIFNCAGTGSSNSVTFAIGGTINATSNSTGYGIYANNRGTTTVSNLGGIEANGKNNAYGIYGGTSETAGVETNVSFVSGGTINATSTSKTTSKGYGIYAGTNAKTYVTQLGGITANGSAVAYGIFSCLSTGFETNVSFVTTGGYINATSASGKAYGIYALNKGTTTVTGLGGIEANGSSTGAYGIHSAGSDATGFENNVSFVTTGSYINATSASGEAYGILACNTGKTYVTNLGGITVNTSGSSTKAYGIYSNGSDAGFANNVSFSGTGSYINATSASGEAYGIAAVGKGTTTVTNLGGIEANGSNIGFGIASMGNDATGFENNVSFASGSYINATSANLIASGILAQGTGKTYVSNLGGIETNGSVASCGICSCGSDTGFANNVSFVTTGGYINATSASGEVSGIKAEGTGTTTVSNLGGITANGSTNAYGIFSCGSTGFENNVSFASGSYINATSANGEAYGIYAKGKGTTTVSTLGGITANTSGSSKTAHGIYSCGSAGFENNVSFATGGYINTSSANGSALGIVAVGTGKTYVSNLGGIEANGSTTAYGISSCGSDTGLANNVSFVTTGGCINATSANGAAYGIVGMGEGKTTVSGLKGIEANGSTTAYGIFSSENANSNVTFADGGKIKATSAGISASGIEVVGTGTKTVTNLGSIEVSGNQNAAGISSGGDDATFNANISFKGNGGQAITATAVNANNAYSIFAVGNGATTVNFENSILSGKIKQNGTSTLTLNFNDKGKWTPTNGEVTGTVTANANNGGTIKFAEAYSGGNVNVNINNGGMLDTRATGTAANKEISLGTAGNFTAAAGSNISFDAVLKDDTVTSDKVKANNVSGEIQLKEVSVAGTTTDAWAADTSKETTLFEGTIASGFKMNGSATATSDGYEYNFTQKQLGSGVLNVMKKAGATLPDYVQGLNGKGAVDTYELVGDYNLPAELGTLNNTQRSSFTIMSALGSQNNLSANGFGTGVAINSGDTMSVKRVKINNFTQFATNAGTLNLEDVAFSGTTGTADVKNSGTLNLAGTNSFAKGIVNNGTLNINAAAASYGTNGISGTGETFVNADTDMGSAALTQNKVTIANGKTLTMGADLTAANGVENNGTVDIAADKLKSNVANGGTVKLGAGTLGNAYAITGGKIETQGDITANAASIAGAAEITNNNTLTLTGEEFANDVKGTSGNLTFTGKTSISGNLENRVTALGTNANLTIKDTAAIANSLTADAGKITLKTDAAADYTAKNGGKITMEAGTLATSSTKTLASRFGAGHENYGFILDKAALLDTTSDQIFTNALTAKGTQSNAEYIAANQNSGAVKATQIDFRGGSLQLNDANYTLKYVATAKGALTNATALGTGKGLTSLVMKGNLITEEGSNVTTVDQIDDGSTTVTTYDNVTALTINGSLLIGSNTILTTEGAVETIKDTTGITVRDTSETSISVDKLDLAETASGLIITNDRFVTLGGASGREAAKASNVIDVAQEVANVDVYVGLDAATAEKIGAAKAGTLTIGNGVEDKDTKYQVTGNVTVNEGSKLNIAAKSETTITKDLNLSGAAVTVNKEGVLNVGGKTTVAEDTQNRIEGTIKGETLTNNGTLTASASDLQFKTIENNSLHTLELTGGEIASDITSTSATGGAIKITGDVRVLGRNFANQYITVTEGKQLYFGGGKATTLTGGGLTAKNGTLAFCLDGFANGSTILDATKAASKVNMTGTNVALFQNEKTAIKEGESIKLIAGAEGEYAETEIDALTEGEGIKVETYNTLLKDSSLIAELKGEKTLEEAKSLSEGQLAGAAALIEANDLIADTALISAKTAIETTKEHGLVPYAVIRGAHGRYTTGSHIDLNSTQVAAGLAKTFSKSTVGGLFIEGGNGRYTSYNSFTAGDVRADGDINYFGAGLFARHDFKTTDKGNAYVDAAFGAGHTNTDYHTDKIATVTDYRYDTGAAYLKAHATFGYAWKLAKGKLDGYAKYLWTHQNGDTVQFNGQDVNFDAINSSRLRAGFRYTQDIKKTLAWYGGLAYEYEFDASAGANSQGLAIAEPDLKGSSGMAEVGVKFAPKKYDGLNLDLGVQGFTGKRDSIGVRLGAWYEF